MPDLPAYDPRTVPDWARETIARIACGHPGQLAYHLDRVAEIDAARRHMAGHPPPPAEPRDILHLAAIQTWQALASGQPAPGLAPADLNQAIYEAFTTSDGRNHVDQICEDWRALARQHGIPVDDEHGDLLPGVDDAITRTVSAAIWFGPTTGYLTLTGGRYHIPRKFLESPGG